MKYDPEKHHRRSIRLKGYDYSQAGAYFVTICTQNRECLFGEIVEGEMRLNNAGQIVQSVWNELSQHYLGVDIDAFAVMPNHIHGIVVLTSVGAGPCAYPDGGQPRGVAPTMSMSLPDVVHRFKSMTTTRYRHSYTQNGFRPYPSRLWQRDYYDHIIRNDDELNRIREYIINNPLKWEFDRENPFSVNYNLDYKEYFKGIYER